MKATSPIKIYTGTAFLFGDIAMILKLDKGLIIKCTEGILKDKCFNFENNDLPIRVGNYDGCNIIIPNGVEKNQCRVFGYDNDFYIVDGDGTTPSSIGTWVYSTGFLEITDNSIIKAGDILFQASIST